MSNEPASNRPSGLVESITAFALVSRCGWGCIGTDCLSRCSCHRQRWARSRPEQSALRRIELRVITTSGRRGSPSGRVAMPLLRITFHLTATGSDCEPDKERSVKGGRIYQADVNRLREVISPRDVAVLDQVRDLKLMSGAQIQAVHFPLLDHATVEAAGRACRRVLRRLVTLGLLIRLDRRIGGIRGGSAGFVYAASPIGHRLLDGDGPRRRFKEPSATFVHHTLAIAQVVVELIERQRAKRLEVLRLEPEPRCWRSFTTSAGRQMLRPDLFVALGVGEFEHHWFIEVDLATETMLRRLAKCKQYEAYYRSGTEQASSDLFPRVLWCLPNQALADDLRERIARTKNLTADIFAVTTRAQLLDALARGQA